MAYRRPLVIRFIVDRVLLALLMYVLIKSDDVTIIICFISSIVFFPYLRHYAELYYLLNLYL